ncbi:MAG: S24 family peptidase [Saccharofermentanales bacterium]
MTSFSKKLRKIMEDRKMSQTELAKSSGITQSSISDYLNDRYEPKQDKVHAIAKALNVSPSLLVGRNQHEYESKISSPLIRDVINNLNELNHEGQIKVRDYSEDLKESGKYIVEKDEPVNILDYIETHSVGSAAAGSGFMYGDNIENYKLFMTTDIPDHDFPIDVKGDSMFPTILDGETAFVIEDYEKIDFDIYILDIDGETVIKRVIFGDDEITLISDNEEYEDRVVSGFELEQTRILGRVVGWEMPVE